ncbi:MAG: alpha/beta hydrolase [Acidimicrobiia bacterium]|nr:alpha/beta hydrolase [Acidimicrobiia bacterium]
MARRSGRRLAASLTILALVSLACSGRSEAPTSAVTQAPPTTTLVTALPATEPPRSTATTATTTPQVIDFGAGVRLPDGTGPFPAVVLVHGGGWVAGSPLAMANLAGHLTEAGFLVVNTPYQLSSSEVAGFPAAVDDVSCAVRYASSHPDSDGSVAVIGHSAGAHIGAIVALTGDQYGSACPFAGTGLPDRFVGLAGPYDVERLGLVMLPFFGAGPSTLAEAWAAGNPQQLTDENPDLSALIMHGDQDGVVELSFAMDFHAALVASGAESLLEIVEGANHNQLTLANVVGDLIVTWLER